jgi:hypothetical protein
MSRTERNRIHPAHLPVRAHNFRVLDFTTEAAGPFPALDVNEDLIARMAVDTLPFPGTDNEPLQDDMFVRQDDLSVRIFQVRVCQQGWLVLFCYGDRHFTLLRTACNGRN